MSMASIVKIRASVFIGGMSWLPAILDPETGNKLEYAADIRGFTPHAVNTGRSRVEQEVSVDFAKQRLVVHANTGLTILRVTDTDGKVQFKEGRAAVDGITVSNEVWGEHEVSFVMRASVSNPLRLDAQTVDYRLEVTVHKDGIAHIRGSHDGFPCYEFYKQVDFGEHQLIHSHHFLDTGDTPLAMAGDMEYHFEKTV